MWSMYWDENNFWKASEENGDHYLKRTLLEGHIVKLNFLIFNNRFSCFRRCLVNEVIFTESVHYEEILLVVVCKEISCYLLPWEIWHIYGEHRLDCLLGLMLGTGLARINIIGNVSV